MVLGLEALTIWLVESLFGGVVYDKAKDLLEEDPFLKIIRKARNEAIKNEENKIVWNTINELTDINNQSLNLSRCLHNNLWSPFIQFYR